MFRSTLLYIPAQVLGPALQLATVFLWAHVLSPQEMGTATLIVAAQEIFFATFFMWWSQFMLRYITDFTSNGTRSEFLSTEIFSILISSFAQSLFVVLLVPLYLGDKSVNFSLAIVVAFALSRSMISYLAERTRAERRILLYSVVQVGAPAAGLALGFLFLGRNVSSHVDSVLSGFSIAQAAISVLVICFLDFGRISARISMPLVIRAFRFGIPVMAASMLALIALNLPRFIVDQMAGIAAAGSFAVGYSLGLRAASFSVMLVTAGAYPLVVRRMIDHGPKAAFEQLSKNMILVAAAVMPVSVGIVVTTREIVDLFVGLQFRESTYAVLPITAVAGLFRFLRGHTTDQVFLVSGRPGYTTAIAVFDIFAAIASTYFGVKYFGTSGGAIGPLISGFFTLVLSFMLTRRFDFNPPLKELSYVSMSAIAMGFVVSAVPSVTTSLYLLLSLKVFCGAATYGTLMCIFFPDMRRSAVRLLVSKVS